MFVFERKNGIFPLTDCVTLSSWPTTEVGMIALIQIVVVIREGVVPEKRVSGSTSPKVSRLAHIGILASGATCSVITKPVTPGSALVAVNRGVKHLPLPVVRRETVPLGQREIVG